MNAEKWDDEEDMIGENLAIKSALQERIEEMARIAKYGERARGTKPLVIKGVPFVDPEKVAAVEMPEDFGKWA